MFVCLLCFMTSKGFSQSYKSIFGHVSTSWDVIINGYCDFVMSQPVIATTDTIVNSKNYKVISGLGGLLREDTTLGKVWFYNTTLHKEYLVMNMNLNQGDTSYIYSWNNDSIPMIVDSVYYVSGLKYLRFNAWVSMCGPVEKIKFIEGSGPNAGFNYDGKHTPVNSYMLCHFKDGIKVSGQNVFGDTCYVYEVGIDEHRSGLVTMKLFPNPATDFVAVNIAHPFNENMELNIYSSTGALVKSEIMAQNQEKYDVRGLANGIYLVEIKSNEWLEKQKLIINR